MATKIPFDEHTTVWVIPGTDSVASLLGPTTAEIGTGVDVTCDLVADGLNPGGGNNSISSGGLCSSTDSQIAGRKTFSFQLQGFRFKAPEAEPLWDVSKFRDPATIVIRYRTPYAQAVADGDNVEVYKGQFGKRSMVATGNDALQMFSVQFHVDDEEDDAYVGGTS